MPAPAPDAAAISAPAAAVPSKMYFRVRLMLAQMAVVLVVGGGLFFLPEPVGYAILLVSYLGLALAERRLGIVNPQTLAVLALAVLVVVALPWQDRYGLHVPALFFGVLALVSLVSMLRGRPISMVYGAGEGRVSLHWMTSGLWLVMYLGGLAVSLVMFRNPGLILALPALLVLGVAGTLWLQLVSRIGTGRALQAAEAGAFSYRELPHTPSQIEAFYTHYIRQILAQTSGAKGRSGQKPAPNLTADIPALVAAEMAAEGDAILYRQRYFVALEGGEIVGSVSILPMENGQTLAEIDHPLRLDALNRYGKVMRCDHFCIEQRHRNKPELIQRLLRGAVEGAFEADGCFLVTLAYASVVPIYTKIGFERMLAAPAPSLRSGAPLMPMIFNLARSAICDVDQVRRFGYGRDGTMGAAGLGERYFKRQVLGSLWQLTPAWAVDTRLWAETPIPPSHSPLARLDPRLEISA
jgi:hypothetical protein